MDLFKVTYIYQLSITSSLKQLGVKRFAQGHNGGGEETYTITLPCLEINSFFPHSCHHILYHMEWVHLTPCETQALILVDNSGAFAKDQHRASGEKKPKCKHIMKLTMLILHTLFQNGL